MSRIAESGTIEQDELAAALGKLGLDDVDAKEALDKINVKADGHISLNEWEAGLDDRLRAAIEAKADALQ